MFERHRFDELAATTGSAGAEAPIDAPMFACHKSPEGDEEACAGCLAAVGQDHLGVRVAVAQGRLDPQTLVPGADWPALFGSYQEMADRQSR